MSLVQVLSDTANAIRAKKGTTYKIKPVDFASEIESIPSGGGESTLKKLLDFTKSTAYMFYTNKNITDLTDYISYSDTENVTNMSYMFYECKALKTIPLLNTSNVTSMGSMFNYCTSLKTIPLLNTSNVTSMANMFSQCYELTSIPQLNTSNVTNMRQTFYYCSKLTTIPPLDTSKVTDMVEMFKNCSKLTTIPPLDTSKVTDMAGMFNNCSALPTIPQLDTSNVFSMNSTFYNCTSLTTIDITHYKISSTSNSSSWCAYCYSLKSLIIRSFGTSYALNSNAFNNCYHLLGKVSEKYNPNGDKDCYIYVPRDMVDTLKSATNWSTYADQIRALEDYTVDGTTTGELDESKVNA